MIICIRKESLDGNDGGVSFHHCLLRLYHCCNIIRIIVFDHCCKTVTLLYQHFGMFHSEKPHITVLYI